MVDVYGENITEKSNVFTVTNNIRLISDRKRHGMYNIYIRFSEGVLIWFLL